MNVLLHFVLSIVLVPQVQEVDSAKLESSSSLLSVLARAGVANPENPADYVHLLPKNNFTSTGRGSETEIVFYTADGQSHSINHVRATQLDDIVTFQAEVDGWDVRGSLSSSYDVDHIKLKYQFQVPLDIYRSTSVTMIIQLAPRYNWFPSPITARDGIGPDEVGIGGVYATECKCVGKGNGDGACVANDCENSNACGGSKECLDTEVGAGATSFFGVAVLPCLLFAFFIRMSNKRCRTN